MPNIILEKNKPERVADCRSAWKGLDEALEDLIKKYKVNTGLAIDIGVDRGFSTVALSNFFDRVIGVDTFRGDKHAGFGDYYEEAVANCKYDNIELVVKDCFRYYMPKADLIHIDIVHDYAPTFRIGSKALKRAPVVIFHDTESFPEVKRAVGDLAKKFNKGFDNYPAHYGLGILYDKNIHSDNGQQAPKAE